MNIALMLRNATPVDPNNLNQSGQIWTYSASVVDNLNDAPVTQQVTLAAGGIEVIPLTVDDIFKRIYNNLRHSQHRWNNHKYLSNGYDNPPEPHHVGGGSATFDPIFTVLLNAADALTVSATLE